MTRKKVLVYALMAMFMLGVVLAISPTATAQGAEARIQSSGISVTGTTNERLAPETATARVVANFVVTVPQLSACATTVFAVDYAVQNRPTYAEITLSPTTQSRTFADHQGASQTQGFFDPGGGEWPGWSTTATVAFTRDAPAFRDVPIVIQAQLNAAASPQDGCTVTGTPNTRAETTIKPDYLPSIQVLPTDILQTSGQNKRVLFETQIINFGNGPTRVTSSVEEHRAGLDAVIPPPEVFLESRATSGAQAQNDARAAITVMTPSKNGYTNQVYSFDTTFRARSDTSGQNLATQEIPITLSMKVQGVYVPGFEGVFTMMAMTMGLLGMVALRRRHG